MPEILGYRASGRDNLKTGVSVRHGFVFGISCKVIFVAEVRRTCMYVCNTKAIKFKQ